MVCSYINRYNPYTYHSTAHISFWTIYSKPLVKGRHKHATTPCSAACASWGVNIMTPILLTMIYINVQLFLVILSGINYINEVRKHMTPIQFYFPYFFKIDTFNKELKPFGLSSYITYHSKTQMPDSLIITKHQLFGLIGSKPVLLTIPFGVTLMIQSDKLFYWKADYDIIDITQTKLDSLDNPTKQISRTINLEKINIGHNNIHTDLELIDFVTFVRKKDLTYKQDYYEKFAIVIINKDNINIIPFDWFNEKGGDYGYVWPATARLDKKKIIWTRNAYVRLLYKAG